VLRPPSALVYLSWGCEASCSHLNKLSRAISIREKKDPELINNPKKEIQMLFRKVPNVSSGAVKGRIGHGLSLKIGVGQSQT
jgi:hypothetical protein